MTTVLVIDNSLDVTGASRALLKTVGDMGRDEFRFLFVFPVSSLCIAEVEKAGYPAVGLPFIEISRRPAQVAYYMPRLLTNTARLRKLVSREKVDIVHVNDIYNMAGIFLKIFSRVKLVTHVRRMPESFPRKLYNAWGRLHIKYADRIIAVSEANRNGLIPNHKTEVIYDPLPDTEKHQRYSPAKILDTHVKILCLANFTQGKGQRYALQILERAVREFAGTEFSLSFIGGDFGLEKNRKYREGLEATAAEMGIADKVTFSGPSHDVEKEMKSHDVVFNLSDSESFSRVTLEALFYGVPVLATDVGGTREMLADGINGILVPAKKTEGMFRGFRQLLTDNTSRTMRAEAGYAFVRQMFSTENTSFRVRAVYEQLCL